MNGHALLHIIHTFRSPHFEPRRGGLKPQWVILHYTGMKDGASALKWLLDPQSKVSAHYLVEEDGRLFSLVNEQERAWHAGQSYWRGETDINSCSIGIEIVNPGHEWGYRPFPDAQMKAVVMLCQDIKVRHGLDAGCFWGHSDIAPMRKEDPGELFEWKKLAEAGIGLWPRIAGGGNHPMPVLEAQRLLSSIGYGCPSTGIMDAETKAALVAFQRHFRPADFSGALDAGTATLLEDISCQCAAR